MKQHYGYRIHFIFLGIILSCIAKDMVAQKKYEFNRVGNPCNFFYVAYNPSNEYTLANRPFIFILANEGEESMDAFQKDSIRHTPEFYNYNFIYIPNYSRISNQKFKCIDGLVNLVTNQYSCGRGNVFLFIRDTTVSHLDITEARIQSTFAAIRISNPESNLESGLGLTVDFEERISETEEDSWELGTFYYDNDEDSLDAPATVPKAKKTYFGPPSTYEYTLSGLIRDRSTGEALPYATVRIRESSAGVITNADGFFTLNKVPSDTSVLIVSYVGYAETIVYLNPDLPKQNFVIEVIPEGITLKDVKITATIEDVVLSRKGDVSVMTMTPRQLEKLPNLGEKDVMRSFQLMPGVGASQESSSGLYVRGGTPDQNLVLYDGFTVYHVDHLYGFFSAFNSHALKDVQLYKGGFESRFGGRLSSVTEITGKDGNLKKFNMGGDFSLLSLNVFAEIPIGEKFSSILAFRRSYQGPIYKKLFEKFNENNTTTVSQQGGGFPGGGPAGGGRFGQQATISNFFYDVNSKFSYRPTERDILSLSIFNGTDKLDNSSSFNAPSFGSSNTNFSLSTVDLTKYGNIGTSLRWARKWSDRLYGNSILSYSNYYSDRNRSTERTSSDSNGEDSTSANGIFENNDLQDISLKSDYQWDWVSFGQLQFGAFGTYFNIDYTYAQNDTTTVLDKHSDSFLAGGYVQNRFRFFDGRLTFLPGIRTSFFYSTENIYYEPRASLTFSPTNQLTLKGAIGKYYQFVNRVTREDILSGSKDFWLLSDGNSVPVSSSNHFIAGISYEVPGYLFSVEAYHKNVYDITEYSLRINPNPFGVDYDENFFTGNGYARGVEFLIQKKGGKFNGWVSYTLGEAMSNFAVYSDSWFPANQNVTHEFKIVALYNHKRWDFSASWIFATGRPYTAPSGGYSISLLDGNTQDYFTVTSKNGLQLPDYHRADISANYKLLAGSAGDKKRREIGYLGFSVFNVYNRTNVWYKTFEIDSGSLIETDVNYTGITPNITLSLKIR